MTKPKAPWRCAACGGLGTVIPRAGPRARLCQWCAEDCRKHGREWCSRGSHAVARDGFTAAGLRSYVCIACQQAANAAWRAANADHAKALAAAYHAAHRVEHRARSRAYYAANREQVLLQKKSYYQQHREAIKAKVRAYRPRRPLASIAKERVRQKAKQAQYWQSEKNRAKVRVLRQIQSWRAPLQVKEEG